MDYYLEALKRDPGDSRCNIMVGINYNRRGMYQQAEQHLRRAVDAIDTGLHAVARRRSTFPVGCRSARSAP